MNAARGLIIIAALTLPAPVVAQASVPAPTSASERRLSPEQIEAVLAEAAKKREATRMEVGPERIEEAPKPQVHGEVGVTIGTGGYREAFGTAIYPLGDDGIAAISLDFVDWGKRRFPR
jgi:hypothetical protein